MGNPGTGNPEERTNPAAGKRDPWIPRTIKILFGLLLLLLIVSLVSFLADSGRPQRRILFFNSRDQLTEISGEVRFLPRQTSLREEVEILVRELCLGPRDIDYRRAVPGDTRLSSLDLREQTLYLDFEPEILFTEEEISLSYAEMFALIRKNVKFNFRFIEEIIITVDGQMPFSPYFDEKLAEDLPAEPAEG